MQIVVNDFWRRKKESVAVKKQSLFEAREKIRPEAFEHLHKIVVERFYNQPDVPKWRGMRVIAVDGSVFEVPNSSKETFGTQKTPGNDFAQARAVAFTDVTNNMLISAQLHPLAYDERSIAMDMVEELATTENDIFLFDRGFYSKTLCQRFCKNGAKFLLRAKGHCQKEIDAANLADQVIAIDGDFPVRVINYELPGGRMERLVTNLFDTTISVADFGELYAKRWGVEINFLMLKERLQIENFSSGKAALILQDFYAAALVYNLMTIVCINAQEERIKSGQDKTNKYQYQINRNVAVHEIRECLIDAVCANSKEDRARLFSRMESMIAMSAEPIRPGRSSTRTVRYPGKKFPFNLKANG
jgi:hypothetical protein